MEENKNKKEDKNEYEPGTLFAVILVGVLIVLLCMLLSELFGKTGAAIIAAVILGALFLEGIFANRFDKLNENLKRIADALEKGENPENKAPGDKTESETKE